MRAYHKQTRQPFCVYLTADEACRLLEEQECMDREAFPVTAKLHDALNVPVTRWEQSGATPAPVADTLF